jgi:NAD(P)H-hydrate epimerase
VLAGIIASLAGQGIDLANAAAAGVFIHGAAGDSAAGRVGEYGMLPSDLIDEIPGILKKYDSSGSHVKSGGGV